MVRCKDGTFYVGITNDVDRRVYEHNSGHDPNGYTFTRRPVELAHVEVFNEVDEAIRVEKKLKG